jgi:hypothetical protein
MLADPIYGCELLWDDPSNQDYSGVGAAATTSGRCSAAGTRTVNYRGYACARSTGKTESIKAKASRTPSAGTAQNLLLTAPELIHLLPLTDAIEDRIRDTRLTREFLDTRGGKTGFTHRPFGVDFLDGTKIVGRIPRLTGTGVKGQHQPDLIIDEGQDYPEAGWVEVHETVEKSLVDDEGNPTSTTSSTACTPAPATPASSSAPPPAASDGRRSPRCSGRRGTPLEKEAAKAAYGGTELARLPAQHPRRAGRGSVGVLRHLAPHGLRGPGPRVGVQHDRVPPPGAARRGVRRARLPIRGPRPPTNFAGVKWAGADLGLTELADGDLMLFAEHKVKLGERELARLKLIRRITLERFRPADRRSVAGDRHAYGGGSRASASTPPASASRSCRRWRTTRARRQHLLDVTRGYFFNAKVPVGVDESFVTKRRRAATCATSTAPRSSSRRTR